MTLHTGLSGKITNFSGCTAVHCPLCSKALRKFVETSYAEKLEFIGHKSPQIDWL